ncbi:hypothetical protein GQ600_8257 [Phytophthora cactorum]|nr:hypothetical protein GQ600_8257 [Phytophthora cactorum]
MQEGRDPLSSSTSAGAGGTNAPATSSTQASALSLSSPELQCDEVKIEAKSTWEELAEVHYHARLQAEEKNHTLKTILASQVQMSEKVCAIVQEQAVFQARYFLL